MKNIFCDLKRTDVSMSPFPHIVAKIPCKDMIDNLPSWKEVNSGINTLTHVRLPLGETKSEFWKEVNQVNTSPEVLEHLLWLFGLEGGAKLTSSVVANGPVTNLSPIRAPHVDQPTQIILSFLYLKLNQDNSKGGDLEFYRWKRKPEFYFKRFAPEALIEKAKSIKFDQGTLVLFPNSINALHAVNSRGITPFPRYSFTVSADADKPTFKLPQESKISSRLRNRFPFGYKILKSYI